MTAIGIIANPAAGKDVRRLLGHGLTVDNQEKVRIVRRVILGARAVGCRRILIMPDSYSTAERALNGLNDAGDVALLDQPVTDRDSDTIAAARALRSQGVAAVIALGGDGTARLVGKAAPDLPLLALSTGTNNVLPRFIEGTVAGMAAGLLALHPELRPEGVTSRPGLVVHASGLAPDLALVDVACLRGTALGSKAVWDWRPLQRVAAVWPRADVTGLSGLVGALYPDLPLAAWVEVGTGPKVTVALAPGLLDAVPVTRGGVMEPGVRVPLGEGPVVVALDGERTLTVRRGAVEVEVRMHCAALVDVGRTLAAAARAGLLQVR